MIGLAGREDFVNYLTYLGLLLVFALLMIQQLAVFASFAKASMLNAYSACVILLLILFSGFIVSPASIPGYLYFFYVWNPFAWIYRALVVSEFRSERWSNPDRILSNNGFVDFYGVPFGAEWVGYAFAYTIPYTLLCVVLTALGLTFVRNDGGNASGEPRFEKDEEFDPGDTDNKKELIKIPFKPVTLSFHDICYEVNSSTGKDTLQLLTNVNGIFKPFRMCMY